MDLKTFLRPSAVPLGARLACGDVAPALPDVDPVSPRIVAFLRHVGCPFAEATLVEMERLTEQHPDVGWVALSHGTAEASVSWHQEIVSTQRVRLLVDAERTHYAAWGLGTTSAGHFLALRPLAGAARLASRGIRNRHPSGSRWQSAGTFAAVRDQVVACHYPQHAADMPDFEAQLRALTE